jgi:hypothetical protein
MHVFVFCIWVASIVVLGIASFMPKPYALLNIGLLLFDLWLGLQFLIETTDPVRF